MGTVMMTVELPGDAATLGEAAKRLGLAQEALDPEYGIVPVDPDNGLYSVLVEESISRHAKGRDGVGGPFSNPRIEPFGPPRT